MSYIHFLKSIHYESSLPYAAHKVNELNSNDCLVMSGKHLLDFISIWQASSSVASKAVGLQRHQLRVYQRTSSLSQALNKGFNNANRTTKSSIILSNRSGEALEQPGSQFTSKPIPDRSAVAGKPSPLQRKDGIRQDHFYEASEANSSAHPGPQGSLKVKQEREQTPVLPDGTISPCASEVSTFQDSDPESRIPRQVADPPPSGSSNPNIIHDPAVGLRVDQKQDVFYSPSGDSSSVESALPKVKVSKHAEREQGGNELVRDEMIDQDVYYSPAIRNAPGSVTPTQAVPERQKTPKNIYSELFRSPKVAKMLSGNQTQNPSQDGKRPTRSDHATIPQEIPKTKIDYRSFTLQGTEAQATRTDDGPSGASEQSEV